MTMHHSFSVEYAAEYGIEEAILIHHFQHWIAINKRMGKNKHDNGTWTYQTQEYISANFPYFKDRHKTARIIKSLINKKVLKKGNFNRSKYDRTAWYAFVNEQKFLGSVQEDPSLREKGDSPQTLCENAQSNERKCTMEKAETHNELSENAQPIPDIKTNAKKKKDIYPPKIAFREYVELTQDQHDDLIAEYGKEQAEIMFEMLNDAKASKGYKYKSDYHVLKRTGWVLKAYNKNQADCKPSAASPADNRKWAEDKAQEYINHACRIDFAPSQVEFTPTKGADQNIIAIPYTDKAFREQFDNALRKKSFSRRSKL